MKMSSMMPQLLIAGVVILLVVSVLLYLGGRIYGQRIFDREQRGSESRRNKRAPQPPHEADRR